VRLRLLGTLFGMFVTKSDLKAFHHHIRQCQQGTGPVTKELTLAARGRDPMRVQLHSVPIRDPASRSRMYRTAITDISARVRAEEALRQAHNEAEDRVRERTAELSGAVTKLQKEISERKRAEEALRESEEGQRTLFESAPDPIVVVDVEGRMERVNRRAEALFGYQRSELIGQTVEMLIPERFRGHHEQHRVGYIGSPHLRPMGAGLPLYGRRKDGSEFPVDIMLSPLASKLRPLVIAVVRDVTEQKQVNETLRQLSIRLLNAQDAERRRIARELHDSTGQNLAAVAMNLSLVARSARALDTPAQKALAESIAIVEGCVREIRTLSYLLHPPMLDERGLAPALRWFVDGFSKRSGMQVDLEVASGWERPTPEIEIALFRVVQESLTNAHRHAESSTARIRLDGDKTTVRLEVRDDGKGLSGTQAEGQLVMGGVGITGMRERITQLRGQLEIKSGRGGTTVRVILPLGSATR
jgi:PAS domain S-box-containing protein